MPYSLHLKKNILTPNKDFISKLKRVFEEENTLQIHFLGLFFKAPQHICPPKELSKNRQKSILRKKAKKLYFQANELKGRFGRTDNKELSFLI